MSTATKTKQLQQAIIRFAGDSGDGMQLAGLQFTTVTGNAGNDLMTFPDFPAEIRAPAGTIPGVSGFQIHFGSIHIRTPGDEVDVLVAMNPAAMKANLQDLKPRGILVVNTDSFDDRSLKKVGYESNPLSEQTLKERYKIIEAPLTDLTKRALENTDLTAKETDRCKNFTALGITYWLFGRDMDPTVEWLRSSKKNREEIREANVTALKTGYNFAETSELFEDRYEITPAEFAPGVYRNISGNQAVAIGLAAAAHLSDLPMLYAGYPITPASDILHYLSGYKNFGIKTFQAEDEIAAAGAALGASYGGCLGITASSGPGIALKSETINLAVMTELPMVIINVQRAGPSTGMPTKTEQTDLLQVMFGRNGESPVAVIAMQTPSDAFQATLDAVAISLKYMTPVYLLSDAYIANGSEPWKLPDLKDLHPISHNTPEPAEAADYHPYTRNPETLARKWASPGMAGFEHRIGGIEKDIETGNISYNPENHDKMVRLRQEKIDRIADFIPEQEVYGPQSGDLLVLGWGSTFGSIRTAVEEMQSEGKDVAHAHLRFLNPFPRNLEKILRSYKRVLIPEINLGQLAMLIRSRFLIDAIPVTKVRGRPFHVSVLKEEMKKYL